MIAACATSDNYASFSLPTSWVSAEPGRKWLMMRRREFITVGSESCVPRGRAGQVTVPPWRAF